MELLSPVWLSIKLATVTTLILLLIGTPVAWWLAQSKSKWATCVEAIVALPLVLPPTVLGFYLLIALGENGVLGSSWSQLTGSPLTFTFTGLVIASVIYSLPFVVQPLQTAFVGVGTKPLEVAWSLRASPMDTFFSVVLPMAARGYITAIVLGFTHTLGEFGVVLMVGGSIPGETQVLSIAIYEQVEILDYQSAHILSAGLLLFTFIVLLLVYAVNRNWMKNAH